MSNQYLEKIALTLESARAADAGIRSKGGVVRGKAVVEHSGFSFMPRERLSARSKGFKEPRYGRVEYMGPVSMPRGVLGKNKGTTIMQSGDIHSLIRGAKGVPKNISPRNKEMINRLVTIHEQSEKKYMGKKRSDVTRAFTRQFSHASPGVIIEESNALATLPKKGYGATKKTLNTFRSLDGTKPLLEDTIPNFKYGKTRVSRHAKKHLVRILKGVIQ